MYGWFAGGTFAILFILVFGYGLYQARQRSLDRWVIPYLLRGPRRLPARGTPVHLLICIADHFEPRTGGASEDVARARVQRWVRDYPRQFGGFRDSDGRTPRHTFFFPIEEYDAEHLDALTGLCRAGYGEVEFHLHHDNDTTENLRATLLKSRECFHSQHGLLAHDRRTGQPMFGFIHGDWALDNSRPDGRCCGVNNELEVLRETGCYADFTFPSVPSPTQPRKVNSIYYALDDPRRPRSFDRGIDAGVGPVPKDGLLLIQGPLVLDWRRRRWRLIPSTEHACLQVSQPAHIDRVDAWLRAKVQVASRPDWFFVKLHTHGAHEYCHELLLGEPMTQFHRDLADRARQDPDFHYHYVTAREMYNLVKAAEDGWTGTVAEARDYQLVWDGARSPVPDL
jgi:hypothetical protein